MLFSFLAAASAALPAADGIWAQIVADVSHLFSGDGSAWFAFGQVLLIDIVLAGDNAIVIGALAAGLPADQRKKVILIGIIAALVLRIGFALIVTQLLQIVGLVFAGGLLLLWVAWKMYRELRPAGAGNAGSPEVEGDEHSGVKPAKSFASAAWAVAIADVSMSLDNVLAVAGAARDHPGILMIGLVFAVALMGIAANLIAKYIERYRWIAWIGLLVIVYVAGSMIYTGITDQEVGLMTLFG
ncbi:MAG: integral rane, YjbE family protein [Sphingomonas bacterium]|uniref:TerC family protein n=1 Tax=Sphingomonas bacterium TaxID=1895847 RepID=UPI002616CAD7|nr:TerC family protein [Sphingomonas bacterium]MDB5696176.1 integral rane, YjbE family protein [Sphingomonas bacterium]